MLILHRIIRFIADRFVYWVLVLLVVEGVLAFALMCIFPPGSLTLVFLGLITLLLAAPVARGLDWTAASLRRRLVRRGVLPDAVDDPETGGVQTLEP